MNFVFNPDAYSSFYSDIPGVTIEPVLINASVDNIFSCWADSLDYQWFIKGVGGVENVVKLRRVEKWVAGSDCLWAPIIDASLHNPRKIQIIDGRHTLVMLNRWGYRNVRIAVPENRAKQMEFALYGSPCTELAV